MAFFEQVPCLGLEQAVVSAFGSTRRAGTVAEDDANLRALIAAGTPAVAIVGKSWMLHVRQVLRTTPEENLAMIGDSVRTLKSKGRQVIYDAEHFFDGYQDDPFTRCAPWRPPPPPAQMCSCCAIPTAEGFLTGGAGGG